MNSVVNSLINREEIRRLEKAAREKDKKHLVDWATQFENQVVNEVERFYRKQTNDEKLQIVDTFLVATAYTAYFSECTKLDKDTLPDFMEDLFVTIDMFRTGEYSPEDYKKQLEACNVFLNECQYDNLRQKAETTMSIDTKGGDADGESNI